MSEWRNFFVYSAIFLFVNWNVSALGINFLNIPVFPSDFYETYILRWNKNILWIIKSTIQIRILPFKQISPHFLIVGKISESDGMTNFVWILLENNESDLRKVIKIRCSPPTTLTFNWFHNLTNIMQVTFTNARNAI